MPHVYFPKVDLPCRWAAQAKDLGAAEFRSFRDTSGRPGVKSISIDFEHEKLKQMAMGMDRKK